jgi:hypothetical protein
MSAEIQIHQQIPISPGSLHRQIFDESRHGSTEECHQVILDAGADHVKGIMYAVCDEDAAERPVLGFQQRMR